MCIFPARSSSKDKVHKSEVSHGPASQQKLSPADDVANDAQLLGRPKYLTTSQNGDPVSDQKARPRRDVARFRLRPASPTGRPGRGGTTLASAARLRLRPASPTGRPGQGGSTLTSDSGPPLRLEGLANSPPTPVLASDSGPPLRPEGLAKEE